MFWFALALGIVLTVVLHTVITAWQHKRPDLAKAASLPYGQWLLKGGALVLLFLTLRIGGWSAFYRLQALLAALLSQSPSSRPPPRADSASMTAEEARRILDVSDQATTEEINASYKKLMRQLHPDAGGNSYLASKLNEARDRLLG